VLATAKGSVGIKAMGINAEGKFSSSNWARRSWSNAISEEQEEFGHAAR
jgi:hypothetical protein